MIGLVRGRVIESQPPFLMVDVGGVGYELLAPMSTFYELPDVGNEVTLYTHMVVREDSQALYGFSHPREKKLFQVLIKANGVGPKLALAIMSGIGTDEFVTCIHAGDSTTLVRIPGIGKKTAERLLIELADKLADWAYIETPDGGVFGTPQESETGDESKASSLKGEEFETTGTFESDAFASDGDKKRGTNGDGMGQKEIHLTQFQLRKDAESALKALGYKPQDAAKAVNGVLATGMTREEVIRRALQTMVKRTLPV